MAAVPALQIKRTMANSILQKVSESLADKFEVERVVADSHKK